MLQRQITRLETDEVDYAEALALHRLDLLDHRQVVRSESTGRIDTPPILGNRFEAEHIEARDASDTLDLLLLEFVELEPRLQHILARG